MIVANVGSDLLLSHPQSELWLKAEHISSMLAALDNTSIAATETNLPDWLNISTGAGQLLISDQRNGRWVLLGADHIKELERRLSLLTDFQAASAAVEASDYFSEGNQCAFAIGICAGRRS